MKTRKGLIYLTLTALLLSATMTIIYSCSKTSSSPAPLAANAVNIQNFAFSPGTINVKAGTTVTWTNMDATAHTVTANGGVFDSGPIQPGQTFQFKFNTAGTFVYHCTIHTMMASATVVVSN